MKQIKNFMKRNTKNFLIVIFVMAITLICSTNAVFAAKNEYAERGAEWVLDGIFWVVIVMGIFLAGMAAIKRNLGAALGIVAAAAIVSVLCKSPETLANLGNVLKDILGL